MTPIAITEDPRWSAAVTIVRLSMRDFKELNRLLDSEESNDRMIGWAIAETLDDYNSTPPDLGDFGLENFLPDSNRAGSRFSIIRLGAVVHLLESLLLLGNRNELNFFDGGVQETTESNSVQKFMSMLNYFRQLYENKKKSSKIAQNITNALGPSNTHSVYWRINGGLYGQEMMNYV